MKFSTREDINASIKDVYQQLSQFERTEDIARARGVQVAARKKTDDPDQYDGWDVLIRVRGRDWPIRIDVNRLEPPLHMHFDFLAEGIEGNSVIELVALSGNMTRFLSLLELRPTSLKGRLAVQTMRLARKRLNAAYKARLAGYARIIEQACQRQPVSNGSTG